MAGLKQMLKNKMDDDRSFADKVSKIAGYANRTGFYKFLNNEKAELDDIQKLIEIVQYAFEDREFDIMDEYIRTLNPKHALARQALEYASVNKLEDLFKFLLGELSTCSNAESKEWAAVYQIDWEVACGKITPLEGIGTLNKLNLKYDEPISYHRIAQYYAYYDLRFINEIETILPINEEEISNLKDGYIKRSYLNRLYAMKVDVSFHKGFIELAKKYAEDAIENVEDKSTLTKIYLQLGNMCLFNGFEISCEYLLKSLELAKEIGDHFRINEARRSLNFTSNYWGKSPQYLDYESNSVSDIHEIAFYHIRNKNSDEGLKILDGMNKDELTNSQMGFHLFYKALATKDKKYFYQSLKHFNLSGEKFYKKLSLIELEKLGTEEDYILESLSV